MSLRTSRRILWLTFMLVVPVPILILGPGTLPPAGLMELGGASLGVLLLESARGVVGTIALVFLVQAALYALLLWLVAAILAWALGRRRGRLTLLLVAALVIIAASWPVYHTRYHSRSAHVSLREVYW